MIQTEVLIVGSWVAFTGPGAKRRKPRNAGLSERAREDSNL